MNQSTAKNILIAAVIYIISQIVLIVTLGKDIELILLSFGLFVASILLLFSLQAFSPGRVKLESVSMRRANAGKDVQEDMLEKGYAIDDEFLKQNPFKGLSRKKTPGFEYTRHNNGEFSSQPEAPSAAPSLETMIIRSANMYGGVEKMKEMTDKMDDKTIERMAKQMGYNSHSANEVRQTLETVVQRKTSEQQVKHMPHESDPETCHPKISLDSNSFNEYIKRCMSGEQEKYQSEHVVEIFEDASLTNGKMAAEPTAATQEKTIPAKVLKRMRGIRKSNGGKMKCENCSNLDRQNQVCGNANLEVEPTDVCDAWQPYGAIG